MKTLEDCLFIARCLVPVVYFNVDIAIGPTSDVNVLHLYYSKKIIEAAAKTTPKNKRGFQWKWRLVVNG